jgi:hypothetical protein
MIFVPPTLTEALISSSSSSSSSIAPHYFITRAACEKDASLERIAAEGRKRWLLPE